MDFRQGFFFLPLLWLYLMNRWIEKYMDTLEDMIAAKLGDVGMVADEVVQEVCELVA